MNTASDTETRTARDALPERTRARKAAVQYLYAFDARDEDDLDPAAYFEEEELSEKSKSFGTKLARDVLDHRAEIDERIEQYAQNWDLNRMSAVDRNLIRLGIAEILYDYETPRSVVINECVELARRLGSSDSNEFVNAIIDRVN